MIIQTNKFVSGNDYTKYFKLGDIDLYMHKAYDDDSKLHFIVFCIPELKELNATQIKYPIAFEDQNKRDEEFANFKIDDALHFYDQLFEEIVNKTKNNEMKK